MNSNEPHVFSVKELSDVLKGCFENPFFSSISVFGEVYSIKLGKFSYIEIGDQGNKQTTSPIIKCAFSCFYGNDYGLEEIKVGDVIKVTGSLSYYPHGCSLTLWGKEVELLKSQLGKNLLLKRKTLEKLDKLGYLDPSRKRKIPRFVKKVAILTAKTGAAYQDILKTLHDRFPVDTVLYPIIAQGSEASLSIVKRLEEARNSDCDVILLGRGGGSKTDLSCFDDEKVALMIAESKIPVITCIGHTIDTAIADRVSDIQAITPTEGAALLNPSLEEIKEEQDEFKAKLNDKILAIIREKQLDLESFVKQLDSLSIKKKIEHSKEKLELYKKNLSISFSLLLQKKKNENENYISRLLNAIQKKIENGKLSLTRYNSLLTAFDPEHIKKMGYSLIYKDGKKITDISQLKNGDRILITYPDGRKEAKII